MVDRPVNGARAVPHYVAVTCDCGTPVEWSNEPDRVPVVRPHSCWQCLGEPEPPKPDMNIFEYAHALHMAYVSAALYRAYTAGTPPQAVGATPQAADDCEQLQPARLPGFRWKISPTELQELRRK